MPLHRRFGNAVTSGSLTALASNLSGGNGLYVYDSSGKFPTNSFNATNYWVDVVFTPGNYTYKLTSVTDSAGCNNQAICKHLALPLRQNAIRANSSQPSYCRHWQLDCLPW